MQRLNLLGAALAMTVLAPTRTSHAAYTVERIVAGLNQPMFVTQAPGDNSSLYIVERSDPGDQLGRIRKFNLQTQTFDPTTFLDLTGHITSDGGVLSMAFHPDFQSNGRYYVTSNADGTNALDEYRVIGGVSQFQRRLLQYQNLNNIFHTINQPFFRPGGNSNELFLTAGDGGTQADEGGFNPALIESPNSIYGKVLKFDLNASFPTPATDATHPGIDVIALGLRNPYRSSFDRQTGDFYLGDVGFNRAEEIDYIPASQFTNPSAPILDFGWTAREGTAQAGSPHGGPKAPGDIDPIFDYAHPGQSLPHPSAFTGLSVTGGYVYRGPIPEFQGRYFFADFLNQNIYSGTFNTSTNPASFNGTNLTNITNHTANFESLVGGGADIRNITSFSEDNAGNLYIVKFGNAFFPPLGQGELFRLTPVGVSAVVNRITGAITLTNISGSPISFTSLSISSAVGAIEPTALTPITGHYDSTGNGSVDNNNPWTITSTAGNNNLFSEMTTGDAGTLGVGQQISLSLTGGWLRSPTEDLSISLLNGASVVGAGVAYVGNSGVPFGRSDLNFNGAIDLDDWAVFSVNAYSNLSGMSGAERYARGDLDNDGDNDFADFRLFKNDFDAVNGLGAFAALTGQIPEPTSASCGLLALLASALSARPGRNCRRRTIQK